MHLNATCPWKLRHTIITNRCLPDPAVWIPSGCALCCPNPHSTRDRCLAAAAETPTGPHRRPVPDPSGRRRTPPDQARRRGPDPRRGRCVPGRPRAAACRHPLPRSPRGALAGGAAAPDRRADRRQPLGRRVQGLSGRPAGSTRSRPGPTCFGTWRDELERKLAGGQHDLAGEMSEGVLLLRATAKATADPGERALIEHALLTLEDPAVPENAKHDVALGPELFETVERNQERRGGGVHRSADRDRGRPAAGRVRRLVRDVPPVLGRAGRRRAATPTARRPRL